MTVNCRLSLAMALALATCSHAILASGESSADADRPVLTKLKPVEPTDALQTFRLAPGFKLEQAAAEPLVRDPVAIEFDENGAAYVIELPPYNAHAKPGVQVEGTIRRLLDADGDGRFDASTVFADGLRYPTGLFCYAGGLFVGDSPDLLYLRDSDGDGRAEQREVLYTGFGAEESGEGRLNSFRWGLDNRIHIATNHDGGEIRPASAPEAKPLSIRRRGIALDPRTRKIELTSGGGQHGFSFDDWGRALVSENSDPIIMLMYDDRYVARNPLMTAPAPAVSVPADATFTNLMRLSPVDPWRIIRLKMRMEGKFPGPTEGGRVSGFFTAATGVTTYRGDAWPAEYRGSVLVGEAANNLVYRARVDAAGLAATTARADAAAEFLASTDTWFRPVQLANAPDGALYVLDMYRELIETTLALPPELLAQLDPLEGSDRGRIYRIVPDGFKRRPTARLGQLATGELVKLLEHANGWHRDTAARLLYERQDKSAVQPLRRLVGESPSPLAQLHALCALEGLGALSASDAIKGLSDGHPRVRERALRLAEPFADRDSAVQSRMAELVRDSDEWVRFQAAFSLGAAPVEIRTPAIIELLKRHGDSPWIRMAAQSSLNTGAPIVLRSLLGDQAFRESASGQSFLRALAEQIGRCRDDAQMADVVHAIDRLNGDAPGESLAKQLIVAMLGEGRGAAVKTLSAESNGRVREILSHLIADAHDVALDDKQPAATRCEAVRTLASTPLAASQDTYEQLFESHQPAEVQQAALASLGLRTDAGVAELVLAHWLTMTPQVRMTAVEVLCARPEWTRRLLEAIEAGDASSGDVDSARTALILSHADPQIRKLAAGILAKPSSQRAEVVAQYQSALALEGDIEGGRAAFRKVCTSCHQLEGVGTEVGADLKAIGDRGLQSMLLNILDPNRDIKPQFLTYVIVTTDGRSLAGIITEETTNNLSLRTPEGATTTLSRGDIEEIRGTGMSYMPEGLEKQLDVQTMADLLAYLGHASGVR